VRKKKVREKREREEEMKKKGKEDFIRTATILNL
jgi:hypothetical protein